MSWKDSIQVAPSQAVLLQKQPHVLVYQIEQLAFQFNDARPLLLALREFVLEQLVRLDLKRGGYPLYERNGGKPLPRLNLPDVRGVGVAEFRELLLRYALSLADYFQIANKNVL